MLRLLSLFGTTLALASTGCGPDPASTTRYADACTTFCHNRYDCLGDPDGRRASCRSACEGAMPAPGTCEMAAITWAECLAALTCTQLEEPDATATYCGSQEAAYDAACRAGSDGGT